MRCMRVTDKFVVRDRLSIIVTPCVTAVYCRYSIFMPQYIACSS